METLNYPLFINPRENRLALEHIRFDQLCAGSTVVTYRTERRKEGYPPEKYFIEFNLNSIIGIETHLMPIYSDKHILEIFFPLFFPFDSFPICYMRTPIWHPNIRFDGPFSGKICLIGHLFPLDLLNLGGIVQVIGEMIQYKIYHALDEYPYPEDLRVAKWVRNFAEPNKIVNKNLRLFTDNKTLFVSDKIEKASKKMIKITKKI